MVRFDMGSPIGMTRNELAGIVGRDGKGTARCGSSELLGLVRTDMRW